MQSWKIHIEGIVQGVGFRPTVYQLACKKGIRGEVSNGVAGLNIEFQAEEKEAKSFYEEILRKKPPISIVTHSQLTNIQDRFFESFQIVESRQKGQKRLWFSPDFAICKDCREEMWQADNSREGYAFITCTQCGPRYSIIEGLPYDRPLTSMHAFEMCADCLEEYHNPRDRRHFSQTNSCPRCGISMQLLSRDHRLFSEKKQIQSLVRQAWEKGEIIAIKGIGGYLFTCAADNEGAIQKLRERKNRPSKPFALMYPSLEKLSEFSLCEAEKEALQSLQSPIVLIGKNDNVQLPAGIADGLNELGVMLPYAPLFEYLLHPFDKAIIATSGNISGSPIIFQEGREKELLQIADWVLSNNRPIVIPQDDSVLRFTPRKKQKIILRRSRGMAPSFFSHQPIPPTLGLWAAGADMKSAFGLLHQGNFYLSQYLGDLSHYDTQGSFRQISGHMEKLLDARPSAILHDLHPAYESSRLAREIAEKKDIPTYAYQHHQAHFAAVLGENELLEESEAVLGVIWDGTGYGKDGQIWGGEFFIFQDKKIERVDHLKYYPSLGRDKMSREPSLSAFSLLPDEELVRKKFSQTERNLYDKLHSQARIFTSSMGRLFDAVAAVLELGDRQSFEGEAAMKLEALAHKYSAARDPSLLQSTNNPQLILREIVRQMKNGVAKEKIAAHFHYSLVEWVKAQAMNLKTKKIAFSGGVFQNAFLVDALIEELEAGYELFFHQQLSPNDENIAYGQLILHLMNNDN